MNQPQTPNNEVIDLSPPVEWLYKCDCPQCRIGAHYNKDIAESYRKRGKLNNEVERLREELQEIKDGMKFIFDEKCSESEVHCGCVPLLKISFKELEEQITRLREQNQELEEQITRLREQNHNLRVSYLQSVERDAFLTQENERLRKENNEFLLSEAALAEELKISDDWLRHTRNEVARLRQALELIACPERPDGTYNRGREACELLAKEALKAEIK